MAEKYIPLFLDFNETTQDLTDEECGRLIREIVRYANGESSGTQLQGMERIAFRFMKGSIDRNLELSATRARAGTKGGMATSKNKQTEAKRSKSTTKTKTETQTKTEADTDTETKAAPEPAANTAADITTGAPAGNTAAEPFLTEDEAAAIQSGHDRVLDAAQNAGFKSSPAEKAGLLNLCALYSSDRIVSGIGECVRHSATNLAYLEGVLKGRGKKKQDATDVHGYQQRDYSSEQQAAIERMMTMDDW